MDLHVEHERKMGNNSNEIKIEGDFDLFSDTVRDAQRAYKSKEWDKFKKLFDHNKADMVKDFDLLGNTAITIAARSDKPELLKEFLGNLSENDRRLALWKRNNQGNTILHDIAVNCKVVEMADIVLDFEKTTPLPPSEEEEEKRGPLVEWKNEKGETPVFKAAKFGNLKMLSHLVKRVEGDMKIHLESTEESILHASINSQFFDVALWIIMNMDKNSLVGKKNKYELTCIQLLVRMPRAFKSHYDPKEWKTITKLIYKCLPNEGYDIEGCDSFKLLRPVVRDLETGGQYHAMPPTPGHLSRANYAVWKYLAQVSNWIKLVWEEKRKHQLADRLADYFVRCDYTWQKYDERKDITVVKLPPVLYNVAKRKQQLRWKIKKKVMDEKEEEADDVLEQYKEYTPMLIAASNGIKEVIHWYMKEHPDSINHVTKGGENILHIAVKHRQEKILELLEDQPELPVLASKVNIKNRTALHQAGRMDYYRGSPLAGAAFQLQEELEWYHRLEKIVPQHLHLHCDTDVLTAGDLLDVEHDHMLADAQKWIKETAQSCSTVAVLVATVVFAAAYTIPNGITSNQDKDHDSAKLFKSPLFIFFTVMDIVALAFSLASVVMFLSILNAPFELWDFHKSLPRKLSIGFTFLFLSLATTMLSFSATILITIELQWKGWTSTLVYGAALFPVTIFALIEFPLYKKIPRLFYKLRLFKKKNTSINRP